MREVDAVEDPSQIVRDVDYLTHAVISRPEIGLAGVPQGVLSLLQYN